jgi:hypothetical protein
LEAPESEDVVLVGLAEQEARFNSVHLDTMCMLKEQELALNSCKRGPDCWRARCATSHVRV